MKFSVMSLKCVIIDDEPLAQECIAGYVEQTSFLKLVGMGADPVELSQLLEAKKIDLVFLDIQMPIMNGIDFLRITKNVPMTIITTAYPSFALEGFEMNVLDYLLKPITFERFFQAAKKATDYHSLVSKSVVADQTIQIRARVDYFFIKCDSKYERIYFNEILFIQALQNYVTIYTEKSKYITLLSLKTVENNLSKGNFIKVHKSYIVSVSKIDAIDNNDVVIRSVRIPMSRNHREGVLNKVVNKNLWKKTKED